jgi:Trypsin-co-occurring domain 1
MAEVIARVDVRPAPGEEALASAHRSYDLTDEDLQRIMGTVTRSVQVFQQSFAVPEKQESGLHFSEINMKFGLSLEGESKTPIVWPLMSVGLKAGATFEVSVTFSRG